MFYDGIQRNVHTNYYFTSVRSRIKEMAGPNISYWPQQLNFAFWCATTGCGISRETLKIVPGQIKGFLLFHIYFTVRRILFQMASIQNEAVLPEDPTFCQTNNYYDKTVFKRICCNCESIFLKKKSLSFLNLFSQPRNLFSLSSILFVQHLFLFVKCFDLE